MSYEIIRDPNISYFTNWDMVINFILNPPRHYWISFRP